MQRYLRLDDTLCVYARIIDENHTLNQWSIIHDKYKIYGDCTLSGNDLGDLIKKTDGVIVRLPSFLGLKACKLAKRYKKPIMIEVVGCAWDSLVNHGIKGKIIAPYCYLKTKHYVKYAPFVLYVTEQYLQNRYPTGGHSISCSDVEIDHIVNSNKTYCCAPTKKYIIGTIGAVDVRYKGQEYVIEALRILKDMNITNYVYHLVGNGDSSYLKGLAAKFGVEDRVVFCGGLPHEKVFSWLDSIDIYIQPSQQYLTYINANNDNIAMVYCYANMIRVDGTTYIHHKDLEGVLLFENAINCIAATSWWFCPKEKLISVGGFENITSRQDASLLMKFFLKGYEVIRVPEILLNYFWHDANSGISKVSLKTLAAEKQYKDLFMENCSKVPETLRNKIEYQFLYRIAHQCILLKERKQAGNVLHKMLKLRFTDKRNLRIVLGIIFNNIYCLISKRKNRGKLGT